MEIFYWKAKLSESCQMNYKHVFHIQSGMGGANTAAAVLNLSWASGIFPHKRIMCFACTLIGTIPSMMALHPAADWDGLLAERQVKVKVGILERIAKARCSGYLDCSGRLSYTFQFEVGSDRFDLWMPMSWGGHSSISAITSSFFFPSRHRLADGWPICCGISGLGLNLLGRLWFTCIWHCSVYPSFPSRWSPCFFVWRYVLY